MFSGYFQDRGGDGAAQDGAAQGGEDRGDHRAGGLSYANGNDLTRVVLAAQVNSIDFTHGIVCVSALDKGN